MNARLPLAAAILIVLAAGAGLAVIQPGDLSGNVDDSAASVPPTTTTTISESPPSGADPVSEPRSPDTTPTTPTTGPTQTDDPTTTVPPVPSPPALTERGETAAPDGAGGDPPRLADTP